MHTMTDAEWKAFVRTGTRTGKLAVTRANGDPHVTPVWFLLDEGAGTTGDGTAVDVVFTVWGESLKARALRRTGRFSLCVDEQTAPYSYVQLSGAATLDATPSALLAWATRLGARYMGPDLAETYGRRNAMPGEYLVRGRVEKVVAQVGIAE
ncbi:PPOX class F420-dependent oxidoreductase [Streptomyces sp. Ru73]|uniref:PPOX class F420-dependent oxidoreductase n=1 Tax=Streptomyces sp. Ru73 TaxID=2080748 RepID=UPI000CDE260D|nr:PPOX class F420-dependent oxidoreductase [Streptomyces sp. Ru73]POX42515.1 PPOX class F420-dependent oxidoreductase [Streptomyces sp. Ru73]